LCPACRRAVALLEAVGGALLDRLAPAALGEDSLAETLALLDRAPASPPPPPAPASPSSMALLPRPLRDYVPDLDAVGWMPISPGFDAAEIWGDGRAPLARLLRLRGGFVVPAHEHCGQEMLLVLDGVLIDRMRHGRGDVLVADGGTAHEPKAEPGATCMCLAVLEGPLRLLDSRRRPALLFE
jgi:putative transcriptional regulator